MMRTTTRMREAGRSSDPMRAEASLSLKKAAVDRELGRLLPRGGSTIDRAMRSAVLPGGKRIRPLLVHGRRRLFRSAPERPPAVRLRPGARPQLLSRSRRPPRDGQRRFPEGPAVLPQGLRRGRRAPRGGRASDPGLRDDGRGPGAGGPARRQAGRHPGHQPARRRRRHDRRAVARHQPWCRAGSAGVRSTSSTRKKRAA